MRYRRKVTWRSTFTRVASLLVWPIGAREVAVALLQLIEVGHADLDPETQAALIPGAGGISRAGQVVRFYGALLDEGEGPAERMLSPEMLRAAAFPHADGSVDRTFEIDIPWGLGFHLKRVRPTLDDCGRTATPARAWPALLISGARTCGLTPIAPTAPASTRIENPQTG